MAWLWKQGRPTLLAVAGLGKQVQQRLHSHLFDNLTTLGQAAAHRLHQYAPEEADAQRSSPVERRTS